MAVDPREWKLLDPCLPTVLSNLGSRPSYNTTHPYKGQMRTAESLWEECTPQYFSGVNSVLFIIYKHRGQMDEYRAELLKDWSVTNILMLTKNRKISFSVKEGKNWSPLGQEVKLS